MLADSRRIGAHLPLGHGMVRAADRAAEIGADAIQVFADNPTAWRRRATPPRELPAWRDRIEALGIAPIAIHAAYLANLAGPDPSFWERSIDLVARDLGNAPAFAARFVNVHVGSHRGLGVQAGTERVAEAVTRALGEVEDGADAAILVLEDSAGGGDGLGTTIEELAGILDATAARGSAVDRLAFCLDIAHLWGAGYDVGEPEGVDAVVEVFDSLIGLDRLRLIHLNDSRAERGSRADRHEHLGAGRIGTRGLQRILTHPALVHVATIIETPGMDDGYDAVNLARARAIAAGEPLEALPPEAFQLRRDSARVAPVEEETVEADETAARGAGEVRGRAKGADRRRPTAGKLGERLTAGSSPSDPDR